MRYEKINKDERLSDEIPRPRVDKKGTQMTLGLDHFQRSNPPTLKGGYDLDNSQNWIREVEKIFHAMDCTNAQKVTFDTYVLVEET
ncbi:hypothetical protein CR513_30621, partial [Mucuna pruriens]